LPSQRSIKSEAGGIVGVGPQRTKEDALPPQLAASAWRGPNPTSLTPAAYVTGAKAQHHMESGAWKGIFVTS